MRKAKEIAKELNVFLPENKGNKEAIKKKTKDIMVELLNDVTDLMKARNTTSDSALLSVLKETNIRWIATCNRCKYLKKTGFKDMVFLKIPSIKALWE